VPQVRHTKTPKTELISPQTVETPEVVEEVPKPPRITVIVVSYNRAELLRKSVEALERSKDREKIEILVVDNGSSDGSAELETDFPNARFIRMPRNFGLTKALNVALRSATGEFILLLHEDTEVSPETVSLLAGILENQNDVGAACPQLVTPDGQPAPQISSLPASGRTSLEWHPADPAAGEQTVEYARGAAIMVRSLSLRAMGKIDERYGTYGSDVEISYQVRRAGKRVLLAPATRVIHHGRTELDRGTRAARDADRILGMAVYLRKRYGIVRGLLYRVSTVLAALGGMLTFRDFSYHLSLVGALVSGQKIDGTQAQ
jgi:GT2 family glycosyltransferase